MNNLLDIIKARHEADKVSLSSKNLISVNGKAIIGAGSFLKGVFMMPAGIPAEVLKEACEKGNRIHKEIQDTLASKAEWKDDHKEVKKWIDNMGLKWMANEVCVYHKLAGIGGFIDSLFINPSGDIVIIDWKSNSKLLDDIVLKNQAQVELYKRALLDMLGQYHKVEAYCFYTEHGVSKKLNRESPKFKNDLESVIETCAQVYKKRLDVLGQVYWRNYK